MEWLRTLLRALVTVERLGPPPAVEERVPAPRPSRPSFGRMVMGVEELPPSPPPQFSPPVAPVPDRDQLAERARAVGAELERVERRAAELEADLTHANARLADLRGELKTVRDELARAPRRTRRMGLFDREELEDLPVPAPRTSAERPGLLAMLFGREQLPLDPVASRQSRPFFRWLFWPESLGSSSQRKRGE